MERLLLPCEGWQLYAPSEAEHWSTSGNWLFLKDGAIDTSKTLYQTTDNVVNAVIRFIKRNSNHADAHLVPARISARNII
jgi:hypothetical protein